MKAAKKLETLIDEAIRLAEGIKDEVDADFEPDRIRRAADDALNALRTAGFATAVLTDDDD